MADKIPRYDASPDDYFFTLCLPLPLFAILLFQHSSRKIEDTETTISGLKSKFFSGLFFTPIELPED